MFGGDGSGVPCALADLADDAVGLLDALGLDSGHVAGAWMGGTVAQLVAIRHPARVRSVDHVDDRRSAVGTPSTAPHRTADLAEVAVPALVVHGAQDCLVDVSGGRATAAAIPGAELLVVDGMGHDLPRAVWPEIIDRISALVARAG